jgi:hypothetical protein
MLRALAQTDIPKREADNKAHLCVVSNGDILCRMMVKN